MASGYTRDSRKRKSEGDTIFTQFSLNKIMLIHGDCLEKLKELEDNSVDSIVTDPPYGLSFMGKKWDYDVPSKEVWIECLRVLKPGGYLLSFAGTRTQHRMAVNIEDAGFEIRDMIAWVYGSGFPKSLNIGKAVDKLQGTEYPTNTLISENGSMSGGNYTRHTRDIESEEAKEYEGWGTALKPALEPITVARKPLSEKNVAENVLKWGTGGINIDGSRVGTEVITNNINDFSNQHGNKFGNGEPIKKLGESQVVGRFPANLIHDGSDEVVSLFPDSKHISKGVRGRGSEIYADGKGFANTLAEVGQEVGYGDSGSAARFFYCAKASKADRDEGLEGFEEKTGGQAYGLTKGTPEHSPHKHLPQRNNHPTVKPTKLMQYLVKLVTPKGGVVLDPFMGSGSTGKACKLEGFDFVGIEMDAEYIKIAEARIGAVEKPLL